MSFSSSKKTEALSKVDQSFSPPTHLAPFYLNFREEGLTITQIKATLDTYGVVVLTNYLSADQAQRYKDDVIDWLISISDDLTRHPATWTRRNMPYGPMAGMMQSLISHCPTVWSLREELYPLFRDLYGTPALFTSMDGATVHPPIYTQHQDWPHLDQTVEDRYCVQGQAVLSNSTACFRCTPTSHRHHRELLELTGHVGDQDNWVKFTDDQVKILQARYDQFWQVPIQAPAGSVILWDSKTIHSAQKNEPGDPGWRCTVYISMRPAEEYTQKERAVLIKAFKEGRNTNHWGTKMFPKRPGHIHKPNRNPSIERYSEHPELVALDRSECSDLILNLVGLGDY